MSRLPASNASTTPVFTDLSGRRARLLTWLARGAVAAFALVAGAVAFTLLTHVSLPGLGGPPPDRPEAPARSTDARANPGIRAGLGDGPVGPVTAHAAEDAAPIAATVEDRGAAAPLSASRSVAAPSAHPATQATAPASRPPTTSPGTPTPSSTPSPATTRARNVH